MRQQPDSRPNVSLQSTQGILLNEKIELAKGGDHVSFLESFVQKLLVPTTQCVFEVKTQVFCLLPSINVFTTLLNPSLIKVYWLC